MPSFFGPAVLRPQAVAEPAPPRLHGLFLVELADEIPEARCSSGALMPSGSKFTSNSVQRSQRPGWVSRPSAASRSCSGVPGKGVCTVTCTS